MLDFEDRTSTEVAAAFRRERIRRLIVINSITLFIALVFGILTGLTIEPGLFLGIVVVMVSGAGLVISWWLDTPYRLTDPEARFDGQLLTWEWPPGVHHTVDIRTVQTAVLEEDTQSLRLGLHGKLGVQSLSWMQVRDQRSVANALGSRLVTGTSPGGDHAPLIDAP